MSAHDPSGTAHARASANGSLGSAAVAGALAPGGSGGSGGTGGSGGEVVRDVVVVGASAGGVEALTRFVATLPADLPATVLVVLHIPARAPSALAAILARHGSLPARTAGEREPLLPGRVVVAAPDHHLVVTGDGVAAVRGPRENGHRPSIDALFRTAASHLGARVAAVVLSGSDDDGTAGALAVHERGGLVYAQSDADALYPTMPGSVRRQVPIDGQGSAAELGALVAAQMGVLVPAPVFPVSTQLREEAAVDEDRTDAVLGEPIGDSSGFVCPDCSGALFAVADRPVIRFRCRVGHGWTADGLVTQQALHVETALWTAVRTLQEWAELSQRLAHRALDDGREVSARQFHQAARDAQAAARVIHELLSSPSGEAAGLTRVPREDALT